MRTSKRAAPGKKTSGLQQKNVEVKTKKNKHKTPGDREGTSETPQSPQEKRAQVATTAENEETFTNRVEVKVKVPEELKLWVFDDWDLITWQKQLFYLSANKNVDSILEDYANYRNLKETQIVRRVLRKEKEYFTAKLGTQPLYKFERFQYSEILADLSNAPTSQVYGAPHLFRPFAQIGAMLAYMPLDEKSLALLLNYLHDLLKYLARTATFSFFHFKVATRVFNDSQ
uniref:MRG domain-containing protein n=1 Tax=Bos indicus x Bos taurus TaxID=30522 RepID=A0A4W2EVS1_BOBOX